MKIKTNTAVLLALVLFSGVSLLILLAIFSNQNKSLKDEIVDLKFDLETVNYTYGKLKSECNKNKTCVNSSLDYYPLEDGISMVVCANNVTELEGERWCFIFPICMKMVLFKHVGNEAYWICDNYTTVMFNQSRENGVKLI